MKKKRWVVGLTGGVASGKSTVLKLLERRGIPSVSSDALAHACIQPGTIAYRAILRHFGSGVRGADGHLDRRALAQRVFGHPADRRRLERIVHPCVIRGLKIFSRAHTGLIILEIPLLFESRLESLVDEIVVVHATRRQQIERGMARAGWTRAEALLRLDAQWPLPRKIRKADLVFDNSGPRGGLSAQVLAWLKEKKRLTP